jgi:hypothetical protein
MFVTVDVVKRLLAEGQTLILAADEGLLRELPQGSWIGGTIPYFMTEEGGCASRDHIFVQAVPALATATKISVYDEQSMARVAIESPDNGYSILILPAFTDVHSHYALNAPNYPLMFIKVIAGWVSGVHLDDMGKAIPKVYDGRSGAVYADKAVAMHVHLPASHRAALGIVNIFEASDGDEIQFTASGLRVTDCLINGVPDNFYDFLQRGKHDTRCPLIADFCGAMINVAMQQQLDATERSVSFYAPVFEGVTYRLSKPVTNYAERFAAAIPAHVANPVFTCNCMLNYLYGELQGRRTGNLVGPMTFGEIAYQLLTQTLVHVMVEEA